MKNQTVLIAIITLLIGGIGGYAISKTEYYDSMMGGRAGMDRDDRYDRNDESREVIDSDMHGMHGMQALTEQEFIEEMIPHHQEAVDTAKQVIARGENAEVKALAEKIVVAQEKEIADMKSWYQTWYGKAYSDNGKYEPMMRDLSTLSGKDLDKAFIEDMIPHHMGALMMAQQVAGRIQHDEIKNLTSAIAETQSSEIIEMRILLKKI